MSSSFYDTAKPLVATTSFVFNFVRIEVYGTHHFSKRALSLSIFSFVQWESHGKKEKVTLDEL